MKEPSGSNLDPWFSTRTALERDVERELAEVGVLDPSRAGGTGRIPAWIKGWAPDVREAICRILHDGRKRQVSPVELAAMVSDFLQSVEHRLGFATLSVYIVRFAAEYVCDDG